MEDGGLRTVADDGRAGLVALAAHELRAPAACRTRVAAPRPEFRERLFERFSRDTSTGERGGAGLGLSIARQHATAARVSASSCPLHATRSRRETAASMSA